MAELEKRRKNALNLRVRDRIGDDELDEMLAEVERDREGVQQRLSAIKGTTVTEEEPEVDQDMLTALRLRLDDGLTEVQRQEIVRLLVRVTIHTEIDSDGHKHPRAVIEYRFPTLVVPPCTDMDSWSRPA